MRSRTTSALALIDVGTNMYYLFLTTTFLGYNGSHQILWISDFIDRLVSCRRTTEQCVMKTRDRGICDPETECFQAYHVIC